MSGPTRPVRTVLTAPSRFHFFELGAELERRGMLEAILVGYPKFKVTDLGVSPEKIKSLPYCHLVYRAILQLGLDLPEFDKPTFDWLTRRSLPKADVVMAMAGSALWTGTRAQSLGMGFVLDRPCSHILTQNRLLLEESKRENIPFRSIPPVILKREQEEYRQADLITVPSMFALRSFLELGFDEKRLRLIPYGVDLLSFYPSVEPSPERFRVLFVGLVGLRKGIIHLLRAFDRLNHPNKELVLVGVVEPWFPKILRPYQRTNQVIVTGHLPRKDVRDYMSSSDVFVLPSIEDGYGVVMSQAMACGTPVVASTNTGAEMLYTDGVEGMIVPAGSDDALTEALQRLADDPDLRGRMAQGALERVASLGGWRSYGDQVEAMIREFQ